MVCLICSKIICQNVLCRIALEANQCTPLTYRLRACCLFFIRILSGICIFRLCWKLCLCFGDNAKVCWVVAWLPFRRASVSSAPNLGKNTFWSTLLLKGFADHVVRFLPMWRSAEQYRGWICPPRKLFIICLFPSFPEYFHSRLLNYLTHLFFFSFSPPKRQPSTGWALAVRLSRKDTLRRSGRYSLQIWHRSWRTAAWSEPTSRWGKASRSWWWSWVKGYYLWLQARSSHFVLHVKEAEVMSVSNWMQIFGCWKGWAVWAALSKVCSILWWSCKERMAVQGRGGVRVRLAVPGQGLGPLKQVPQLHSSAMWLGRAKIANALMLPGWCCVRGATPCALERKRQPSNRPGIWGLCFCSSLCCRCPG